MKHKHSDLIKAWADGAEIEYYDDFMWQPAKNPSWSLSGQYRVKPEPKPKEYYDEDTFDVQYLYAYNDTKNGVMRFISKKMINLIDWEYMGKVRLEK